MLSPLVPTLVAVALAGYIVWQRVRHRDALEESDAKFRTLLEHAPEAVVILDLDAGTFSDLNERAVRLFGRTREELLTLTPADVSPRYQPDGRLSLEAAREVVAEAASGGTPEFEWYHENSAGEVIPCEVRLVRLPASDRALVRGSIVDITRRKEAEERARAFEERLQQSRKLEALGQLTGGVAHDFNNILTVAMGNLQILLDDLDEASDLASMARESLDALARGATLTSQLLAFSRRQPLRPEAVDAGELIGGMIGLLRSTLGETITVEEAVEDGLWPCRCDRAQLESALVNLALNARDAMPNGGTLEIEVRNRRASAAERATWFANHDPATDDPIPRDANGFIEIVVSDDGAGMSAETLERAFDPFYTTKEVGKGSGLGLSMIYGFAKQSGGHVEMVSELGAGTTVYLRLPRSETAPASAEVPEPESVTARRRVREGRVLVVEDDPGVRQVGVAFLESMGFSCVAVADAVAAIELLETDTAFDLLFTDVVLPRGIDGVELARRVRAELPGLPIVFCSGYSEELVQDMDEIRSLGPLVSKPYTREDLARVL